jgi:hypothetical protein
MAGTDELIPLPLVLRELPEPRPSYRNLYTAALDDRIPAERVRGRWQVRRRNLPKIIEILRAHAPNKSSGR